MTDGSAGEGPPPWHTVSVEEALAAVDGDPAGLSTEEASRRLATDGPNRLPRPRGAPAWVILLRQFKSPLIYVLAVAAAVSIAIGHPTDAAFIGLVLGLNALIGGFQEYRAEQTSQALQQLVRTRATVERDGGTHDVDSEEVVPGDVVRLESGYRVPADVRLLSSTGLEVDESALTGESVPVQKDPDWTGESDVPLGDRRSVAFAGTTVTRGRARAVVVETGESTVLGRLAEDVTAVEGGDPPLLVRMERFTRVIAVVVLLAAILAAVLGVVVHDYGLVEMFLFAVALSVSAIPEGLPVAMTVALGVASRRMAAVGVIVRRLVAVEGLGSCTLIATDKTGTLTRNELTVRRVELPDGTALDVTGEGYAPDGRLLQDGEPVDPDADEALTRLATAAARCNEGQLALQDEWHWRGDPTDVALLSFAHKAGVTRETALDGASERAAIPFEAERRFAATFHAVDGGVRAEVKGAPERVLGMCDWADPDDRERIAERASAMARDGYRVLALAAGPVDGVDPESPAEPSGLTFLGFVGMIDPLRAGVVEAVASAREAGIEVSMVTGDHPETALAIARQLGLADDPDAVVTGRDVAEASDAELAELVGRARVFARVAPDQKLRIVEAAQGAGHFVAVTGDGVNDAPALSRANVGVAMGRGGTDVARDAAELVLSDDNFATVVAGIEQGRVAYDNIRKVVFLLVSTGAGELVLVLATLAAGMPLPLLPAQILWLNLVTNGIQDVALAFEPKERDVLARPPRDPDERIFDRLMTERTVVVALVMGIAGFLTFGWLLEQGVPEAAARNQLFLLLVLFELVNIGNARSETRSLFGLSPLRSPILLGGTLLAMLVHVVAMYLPPAQAVLGTAPVSLETWVGLGAIALTVAVAGELHKLSWRRRYGDRRRIPWR